MLCSIVTTIRILVKNPQYFKAVVFLLRSTGPKPSHFLICPRIANPANFTSFLASQKGIGSFFNLGPVNSNVGYEGLSRPRGCTNKSDTSCYRLEIQHQKEESC